MHCLRYLWQGGVNMDKKKLKVRVGGQSARRKLDRMGRSRNCKGAIEHKRD